MIKRSPMTIEGEKKIKEELERLERVERPKIIQAIAEARAHGDLKENAEYHAAKEQQGFIEGRIRDIKQKLSNIQVIDVTQIPNNGSVIFGSTVTLYNLETEEKRCYRIVGEDESNIKEGKISIASPVARALIGKTLGEEVEVNTPSGQISFEISAVEYI
jgi:transcription elongation factor GreA